MVPSHELPYSEWKEARKMEFAVLITYGTYSKSVPGKGGKQFYGVSCERHKGDIQSSSGPCDSEAEVRSHIKAYVKANRSRMDYILDRPIAMTMKNTYFYNATDLPIYISEFFGDFQMRLLEWEEL